MLKKLGILAVGFILLMGLSGCATAKRKQQTEQELQGLRNQVSTLESQVQSKDEEISSLKSQLEANQSQTTEKQSGKNRGIVSKKCGKREMDIQTALKNAGFYKGDVDGKIGAQTVAAIKDFQKANNLSVTGKVSKKTWRLLRTYLNKEAAGKDVSKEAKPAADHLK